ncbi:MAG TPA: TonB-dependent receptor [Sphingomonadaceae bacterium]|nr:TonB-dependent receptor [Sphingomonadaceae bacterium]
MKPCWLIRSLLAGTMLGMPAVAVAQVEDDPVDQSDAGLDDEFADQQPEQPDVSMSGEIIVTGRRRRDEVRTSDQVVNVLSTEDIARTGEGDIAGALSRVTGLSVVGDGYVYVRGLGDRYSLALLNGLPLPSPEPLKRVVPLDLFPTNVIASSLVQKSYSANYPGEFGGGVVNLTTIAVPDESFLDLTVGGGADTETTFHLGYSYYGSQIDWSGFDNGARDIPPALQAFFDSGDRLSEFTVDTAQITAEIFRSHFTLTQKLKNVPADWNGKLTAGTSFYMGDAYVGVIATAGYNNEWLTRDIIQQQPEREDLTVLDTDGRTVNTQNKLGVNGLLGIGVEIGDHQFRITNLFIRDTIKETRLGEALDNNSGNTRITQNTAWYERQLFNSQIVGELQFGDLGLELRGGYANSQREAPFETSFLYVRTNAPGDPYGEIPLNRLDNGALGAASVAFSDLNEDLWAGGVDLSYLFSERFGAAVGYSYTDSQRESSRREFTVTAPSDTPTGIFALRPDLLIQPPLIDLFNYSLFEFTENSPAFGAGLEVHAGYGKINWELIDYLTLDLGVRFETATQIVNTIDVFNNPVTAPFETVLENEYWLPGATLTWEASTDLQLRANVSKTIARPQFRELLPILYYDPETNRSYRGNPLLSDSELLNAELRAEYYLGGPDRISVAGFYKKIDNPIETSIQFAANGTTGSYANAPQAELYGVEVDLVKYFDLAGWGGMFDSRRFFLIGNYTFTDSKLVVGPDDIVLRYGRAPTLASNVFVDGTPLTGQSDHIANLQVGLEDQDRLSQQTILVNYASQRIVGRGDGAFPDIIERPGITLDFVWRQGINLLGLQTDWKFQARNILGENNEEFQATADERIELNTYDRGTEFSISVTAKF